MDFSNRGSQPMAAPTQSSPKGKKKLREGGILRVILGIFVVSIAILLGALAVYLAIGGNSSESKYVDGDKFQAVFLNGGQVYFGKIRTLNNQYLVMDNIYYLRVNSNGSEASTTSSAQDVSLAKLGCELHGPDDQMIINRDQVSFWENLKTDGQVAKAVATYVQQNPQGQKCTDTSATTTTDQTTTPAATTTKK